MLFYSRNDKILSTRELNYTWRTFCGKFIWSRLTKITFIVRLKNKNKKQFSFKDIWALNSKRKAKSAFMQYTHNLVYHKPTIRLCISGSFGYKNDFLDTFLFTLILKIKSLKFILALFSKILVFYFCCKIIHMPRFCKYAKIHLLLYTTICRSNCFTLRGRM